MTDIESSKKYIRELFSEDDSVDIQRIITDINNIFNGKARIGKWSTYTLLTECLWSQFKDDSYPITKKKLFKVFGKELRSYGHFLKEMRNIGLIKHSEIDQAYVFYIEDIDLHKENFKNIMDSLFNFGRLEYNFDTSNSIEIIHETLSYHIGKKENIRLFSRKNDELFDYYCDMFEVFDNTIREYPLKNKNLKIGKKRKIK